MMFTITMRQTIVTYPTTGTKSINVIMTKLNNGYNRRNQISAMLADSQCVEGEVPRYCTPNCAILVVQIRVLYDILTTMYCKSVNMADI